MKLSPLSLGLAAILGYTFGCGGSNSGSQSSSAGSQNTSPASPNVLNGQYAFVLSGSDAVGNPMAMVGSMAADGLGHIIGGSVVVNDNFVVSLNNSGLAGAYSLDSNVRGTITLTNAVGSVAQPLAFAYTLRTDGTSGSLIGIGSNNFLIAGTLQRQDSTTFSLSALGTGSGSFAFELDSNVPSRSSTIGRFTLPPTGMSTGGLSDVSISGVGPSLTAGPLSVAFAAAGPDANGKGSLSLSQNGAVTNYIYFVISSANFFLMQTDTNRPNTLNAGVAERQNLPFSTATVNTSGSIFALSGFDSGLANDIVAVGRLQVMSSNSATLLWDTDDAGTIFSQKTVAGEPCTFDASTGRGTVAIGGGAGNGLFDQAVFYVTDSGKGFLLDASAGQLSRALAGRFAVQASGAFNGGMLSGNAIERHIGRNSGLTTDFDAEDALFSVTFNTGTSTLNGTGMGDFWSSGSSGINRAFSVGESVTIDANTGRGTLAFATATSPANVNVFYLIGPDNYVVIDETQPPHNDIPVQFFDPEQ
jgi:hypothetical protein